MRIVVLLLLLSIPMKLKPMRLRYWEARNNFICDKKIVGFADAYEIARIWAYAATNNYDVRGK